MNKKYIVHLTSAQRTMLEQRTRTGTTAASVQRHARILLKADTSADGPACGDAAIAERVRHLFVEKGLDAALRRKPTTRRSQRKLDGAAEAQLVALTCSSPPQGAERWTLALLAAKLIELKLVDSIARDTVRLTLKKTNSNRG